IEGGELDIPNRRQSSWWSAMYGLDGTKVGSPLPAKTQLEALYFGIFGWGSAASRTGLHVRMHWPYGGQPNIKWPLRRTESLVRIDEKPDWAQILIVPDPGSCCSRVKTLQVREFLREWQEGLKVPRSLRFSRAKAGLMREIGAPLVQRLGSVMKRVGVVSGNSLLDQLPIAAVRDLQTGKFLMELYEIFVLPEYVGPQFVPQQPPSPPLEPAGRVRAIGAFTTRGAWSPAEPRILLVVGAASPADLNPLIGGEREIEELARRFPNHRILRGAEATKERVLAGLQWATIAHFATHGLIDGDDPDDTRLLLLPGSTPDSRLTVGDVRKLSVPHLRLVVLSTCNSGRSTGSPESF